MKKNALNAPLMKQLNRGKIIEQIRIKPVSRADLAKISGLTRSAVSIIVDQLLEEKFLIEGNKLTTGKKNKSGRNATELKLNPHKAYIIGIDISRQACTIGISDYDCNIFQSISIDLISNLKPIEEILEQIKNSVISLVENTILQGTLLGIGISSPGPLDIINGKILNPPNFHKWHNLDIVEFFKKDFDCPILLENDAKALSTVEKYYGIGNNISNYIFLAIDTGIGGGLILDGKSYHGTHGNGSDFGHISIDIHGEECGCGGRGCAELYASLPNIIKYAVTLDKNFDSWENIIDSALSGNKLACEVVEKEALYLGSIITSGINILDVDIVILYGKLTYRGEYINKLIEDIVNSRFVGRHLKRITILSSQIPEPAYILASVNLIIENIIPTAEN